MTQPDWSARLVKVIAGEVKRWRTERGMSAQQLADACKARGHAIPRSVLANLESGRREALTVPELLVLARALEIPPPLLLLPLGQEPSVEVIPGHAVPVTDALVWLAGERPLPGEQWVQENRSGMEIIPIYVTHQHAVEGWTQTRKAAERFRDEDIDRARGYDAEADRRARLIGETRQTMRALGLVPPALPNELAYLDEAMS